MQKCGKNIIRIRIKSVGLSLELRSKKKLIENFIAGINDIDDVGIEWYKFVVEQKEK